MSDVDAKVGFYFLKTHPVGQDFALSVVFRIIAGNLFCFVENAVTYYFSLRCSHGFGNVSNRCKASHSEHRMKRDHTCFF